MNRLSIESKVFSPIPSPDITKKQKIKRKKKKQKTIGALILMSSAFIDVGHKVMLVHYGNQLRVGLRHFGVGLGQMGFHFAFHLFIASLHLLSTDCCVFQRNTVK